MAKKRGDHVAPGDLDRQIIAFGQILEESDRAVFFGGAGVSTESGIPDFRSSASRQRTLAHFGKSPEEILSAHFFAQNPSEFYRYVRDFLYRPEAEPNAAHHALAKMEAEGKLTDIITQNIDGLHQRAGSGAVWQLHGSLANYGCLRCGKEFSERIAISQLLAGEPVPHCSCGGILKPRVVLYGEDLPAMELQQSVRAVSGADTLIVAGTSLQVQPAAGLLRHFAGDNLVVVNLTPTPADWGANMVIRAPVGKVLGSLG